MTKYPKMRTSLEFLELKAQFERMHNRPTSAPKFSKIMVEFAREKGFPHTIKIEKRKVRRKFEEHFIHL